MERVIQDARAQNAEKIKSEQEDKDFANQSKRGCARERNFK